MVNNVAFSIFVADHLPGFFLMIPAFIEGFKEGAAVEDIAVTYIAAQNLFILFIVKLFQIVRFPVLAFVILYMPAFRRKRTVTYRIYLCILSIMTLIAFVNCWRNCTATVGFFSSLVRFLSEAPEAILTNDFQFLPVDFFIPAILSIILSFFILPITTIYSIFWKELS
ncbi:MAG: hypothetical protein GY845_00815 [Planctomycetes bacterium]|nr:hypothetical protein [Planctomycetota bacterium]